ncbi:MAG: pyruvate formate-lyase-activating protein [Terriglobia bacterium]
MSNQQIPLEAKTPFELRVDLGKHVPENEVRKALASGDLGFVHSFTPGSTVDGPGVRVVIWLTGCQFRCLYCHNPDTWNMMNGVPVVLERAKEQLGKYRHGLKIMRGGVTISGGEPLLQHRFVIKLMDAARSMGIHTALDTNGYLGSHLTEDELEKIDLFLLDIKAWNPERHFQLTGMEVNPVLEFARRLAVQKRPVWLRYVLVPGLTDEEQDIKQLASFTAGLGNVERVDVLPFHQLGAYKWQELRIEYKLQKVEPPTTEGIELACAHFSAAGLKVC